MDKSFLSQASVVDASKDFVCIRLATYEDKDEAAWLKDIFVGRSGKLENTVFALLAPDGKKTLTRSGRGPNFAFRNAEDLAAKMAAIAKQYPAKARDKDQAARVPQMKDFRLSLNVASCDGLPLIVGYGSREQLKQFSIVMAKLAFDPALRGKFHYFVSKDKMDLAKIKGFKDQPGIYLVRPGKYGTDGSVEDLLSTKKEIDKSKDLLAGYSYLIDKIEKSHNSHVQQGIRDGVDWKTETEVTDPGSLRAIEQRRKRNQQ